MVFELYKGGFLQIDHSFFISVSIVSHGQLNLVKDLLSDLVKLNISDIEVLLTLNIPENEIDLSNFPYPLQIIRNLNPKGFGANHNYAFHHSKGRLFLVLNPDIRLRQFNFEDFASEMVNTEVGAMAPVVLNSNGNTEESARKFPKFSTMISRFMLKKRTVDYFWDKVPIKVDWIGGMFMLFRRESFLEVGGFDSLRFYMYYEDVDICHRLAKKGWSIILNPTQNVIHDAQHDSHKKFKYFIWHVVSAVRYLTGK